VEKGIMMIATWTQCHSTTDRQTDDRSTE